VQTLKREKTELKK